MNASSLRAPAILHLGMPLLLAPLIWWLFHATDIDRSLIGPYYDAGRHMFPLRDDAFMGAVMHTGLRLVVIGIGMAVFGAFLLSYLVPQLAPSRRRLLWIFGGMLGATLLVSLIKQQSALHCPWDLVEYGGYAPFHGLFERLPVNVAPGHCFPGGHASGGFALIAFYFGLRDTDMAWARILLVAGLVMGGVMGWAQMMRGAHFLSHTVWSAWLEWMFLAVLYRFFPPHAMRA